MNIERRRWLSHVVPLAGAAIFAPASWAGDTAASGHVYMGREIADPMPPSQAAWLERPSRARQERPDLLVQELQVTPQTIVADIGAGTGYLARSIAPLAARVLAVELQSELLARLEGAAQQSAPARIEPLRGEIEAVPLAPQSVDLALLVDTYHELACPDRLLASLCEALRPGGRLAIAEYRAEDTRVPIPARHKMTEVQILRELAPMPLAFERRTAGLPWQHLLLFRRL